MASYLCTYVMGLERRMNIWLHVLYIEIDYIYMCMYLRTHISEPRGQEAVLELGVAKPSPRARHRFKTEPFQREAHESAGQTLSFQVGQLNLVPKVVALALSSYLWSVCGEQTNISLKLCFVYHWLLSRPV